MKIILKGSPKLLTDKMRNISLIGNISKYSAVIPGPKYYPILGSMMNAMITIGSAEKLHLTMDNYHRKFGPIFQVKLGETSMIFVSSGEFIRTMFQPQTEGKYPKHQLPPAWIYFNQKHQVKRGLLFMDNEEWLKYRQPLNNHLLRDTQWCEKLNQQTCENFVDKVKRIAKNNDGRVDNLEDEIYLWSTYSIVNLMVGSTNFSNTDLDEKIWTFLTTSRDIMKLTAKLNQMPVHFADRWNMSVWKSFENATWKSIESSKLILNMLDREIQCSDSGLFRKLSSDGFSREEISRILIDLLIASSDTSVNTVLWMLHHIAMETSLQEKLRSVAKTTDEVEFPLMRGTMREVLRLYPVAPFISRIIHSDTKFGDFIVPSGSLVASSMFTAGRDPLHFSEPLRLIPERWIRDDNKTSPHVMNPQAFVPFAIGARSCVGRKVATYEISCLISKILQKFSLSSLNNDEVNFTVEMVGIPDKKIRISFVNLDHHH